MWITDVLHELHYRLTAVHHRTYQHHGELSLQMMELDVVGTAGMDKHGEREGFVDAEVIASPLRISATIDVCYSCKSR